MFNGSGVCAFGSPDCEASALWPEAEAVEAEVELPPKAELFPKPEPDPTVEFWPLPFVLPG